MGNMVAVFNSALDATVADLMGTQGEVLLPVAGKGLGAYQIEAGQLTFAVLDSEGALKVNGQELIRVPAGLLVRYDHGHLRIRPYYLADGHETLAVTVNGHKLMAEKDALSPYYVLEQCELPLQIGVERRERVRAMADFEQREVLVKGETKEGIQQVVLLPRADTLLLESECASEVAALRVDVFYCTADAAWQPLWRGELPITDNCLQRSVLPFTAGPLEVLEFRIVPLDRRGQAISARFKATLLAVYKRRPIPSMSYAENDLITIRLLYPYAYEHCQVKELYAEAFSQGEWRPLSIYVGENGQHINRLYRSEFTTYIMP